MSDESGVAQLGIIKFYNPRKGYGFVSRQEGNDVFFHLSHFRTPTSPVPGDVVRFQLGQNREGLTAEDIVVVASEDVECYGGSITHLEVEGGVVTTPDNFAISFRREDYIPHARAESLRVGDEVEFHFPVQDEAGQWHAKVVRAPDFRPEHAARVERREVDDEEENRRLLGILYKTDLDEEALHAGHLLAERNMRATLSALVSRIFDRRLERETRAELVALLPAIYFDDECQSYLEQMAVLLNRALEEEDAERSPAACDALRLLLDEDAFPMRWWQYLLPFGLTLLRNVSTVPSCHALLDDDEVCANAERWLMRVCRHVEQRRSGYGYVMTTALTCFDELWQREALRGPLQRVMARLLVATDADGLANQIYHLRDKLSPAFLPVLLPLLSQHPDLSLTLQSPSHSEIFSQWVETLVRGAGGELSTELLATVLPLVEEVRTHLTDEEAMNRLMRPVTESLTPDEVVRMLTAEDLPQRAVWACLRHLDRRGDLQALLADPSIRDLVTGWLRRTTERPATELPRGPEVNTALRLIDQLRGSAELTGELSGIGRTLFHGIHDRLAQAGSDDLLRLLDQLDIGGLPGLTQVLARRLTDDALSDVAHQRLVAYFAELDPLAADAGRAVLAWTSQRQEVAALDAVVAARERCEASENGEVSAFAQVVDELLEAEQVSWHDAFIVGLEELPIGGAAARLQEFAILVPQRLFVDPSDFAPNRYVRLFCRRGLVLGVVPAPVVTSDWVCGQLAGPLFVDERNAMVGLLLDSSGERCYFEMAQMAAGQERPLREGDLLRFTRLPAAAEAPFRYVAFNVHAEFGPADAGLLADCLANASAIGLAVTAGRRLLECDESAWRAAWAALPADRRTAVAEVLDETERAQWLAG